MTLDSFPLPTHPIPSQLPPLSPRTYSYPFSIPFHSFPFPLPHSFTPHYPPPTHTHTHTHTHTFPVPQTLPINNPPPPSTQGYKQKNAFIIAEGPLNTTCCAFWQMIHQFQCGTIVMLSELIEYKKVKETQCCIVPYIQRAMCWQRGWCCTYQ
jgi:hypothetical protein